MSSIRPLIVIASLLVGSAGMAQPCTATNSLTAPMLAGNGQDGVMFDINATTDVEIKCFEMSLDVGTASFEIWSRPGTHVGFEMASTGWTMVGTANSVTTNGTGVGTPIPINVDISITTGNTQAF